MSRFVIAFLLIISISWVPAVQAGSQNGASKATEKIVQKQRKQNTKFEQDKERNITLGDVNIKKGLISLKDLNFRNSRIGVSLIIASEVNISKLQIKNGSIKAGMLNWLNSE